ncbi:MAG: hypothetical protein N3A62_05195 [Thermodesulfovibrionales bacterium]|nr:hypothetical protein [Thermodesulfovibrionales bacterium]
MFIQQIINGLTLGSVYSLIALGYTMVYGILEFINFAHGEIYMIGAYLGIIFLTFFTAVGLTTSNIYLSLFLTMILTIAFCCAYGYLIERVGYRPLRYAPRLSPLISAIGISIFLQNFVMFTQGATDKVIRVEALDGFVSVWGINLSYLQVAILTVSFVVMIGLNLFVNKTKIGTAMRATAQDKIMASLVGIDINMIISLVFVVGAGLASVAGVMVAGYYGLVNYHIGYIAGLKAFTAAVLGGIGSIQGAMIGGLILGIVETLGSAYVSSDYKDVYAFLILIVVLLIKPTGLLGQRIEDKI